MSRAYLPTPQVRTVITAALKARVEALTAAGPEWGNEKHLMLDALTWFETLPTCMDVLPSSPRGNRRNWHYQFTPRGLALLGEKEGAVQP